MFEPVNLPANAPHKHPLSSREKQLRDAGTELITKMMEMPFEDRVAIINTKRRAVSAEWSCCRAALMTQSSISFRWNN